jgi:hypothetical protein
MKANRCLCLLIGLLPWACSSSSGLAVDGGGVSPDSGTAGAKLPAPPLLRQFESGAEAMSEAARGLLPGHQARWDVAQSAYTADAALWPEVRPMVAAAGVAAATLDTIEAALRAYALDVQEKRQRDAETDANKITNAVPDLFDPFQYNAPTDTLRLDGTFRQLQIEAEFADWQNSQKWLDDTSTVWKRLKVLVEPAAPGRADLMGALTVVKDMEAVLAEAQRLIAAGTHTADDATALVNQAQLGLDLTDVCEQIFK